LHDRKNKGGRSLSNHEETLAHGLGDGVRASAGAELADDGRDVELRRVRRHAETPGDDLVGGALGQKPQHLQLARSEIDVRGLLPGTRQPGADAIRDGRGAEAG
jgi:hypothetical protein